MIAIYFKRRQEGFRYAFNPPIEGTFQLVKRNDQPLNMKPGAAKIIDLSPNGIRLSTGLDIPAKGMGWEILTTFTLNEVPISLYGTFAWKKKSDDGFYYGIECKNRPETQEMVVREMKKYIKSTLTL